MDFIIHGKKPTREYLYFNKNGKQIDNDIDKVYAKILFENSNEYYFIITYENLPLDPIGPYQRRQAYLETKMKKVDKTTFDHYVTYLQTNNSIYLTKTNRSFHNG